MSTEITITLPDGSQKQAPVGISGLEIASMIGAGLAKAAIAFSVNGEQRDLSDIVNQDSDISILPLTQMKVLKSCAIQSLLRF